MECCKPEGKQADPSKRKVVLIGNPNVGKSVVFNYLTGKYVTVSNYPGTTVEVATGTMTAQGKRFQVVDTPGINSLIPMSEDERVTRDILLSEPQRHLVQVIDAKNLRRGLLISLQLLEMGLPFLILLNMWDEAKSRGIEIQTETLTRILGTPVLKTVATRKKGVEKIKENLQIQPPSSFSITYPEAIEEGLSRVIPLLPEAPISRRSLALMLLAGDESLAEWLHQNLSEEDILKIEKIRQEIQTLFADPIGYLVNQARLREVDELLSQVIGSRGVAPKNPTHIPGKTFDSSLLGNPHPPVCPLGHLSVCRSIRSPDQCQILGRNRFRKVVPPAHHLPDSPVHSHPTSPRISHRSLRGRHHGPHLCHRNRSAHCGLFLSYLWAHGGFWISPQAGGNDQQDF